MDTANLISLVEHLEDNVEELEEHFEPLLSAALGATTKKLPLLDKAKLYVLIVYSIESLLFSYLRLNGVKAKDHPVFRELTRVKQYFQKINIAEEGPTKPRENLSLNKQAAARVIKHALVVNSKYDLERVEREAKEKLMAKRRLKALDHQKSVPTEPHVEGPEDESQYSVNEAEDGEVEEVTAVPPTPSLGQPASDKDQKKEKKNNKRKSSKAEKKARKRKRERGDQSSQKWKKKKTGKGQDQQERNPPADRNWIGQSR